MVITFPHYLHNHTLTFGCHHVPVIRRRWSLVHPKKGLKKSISRLTMTCGTLVATFSPNNNDHGWLIYGWIFNDMGLQFAKRLCQHDVVTRYHTNLPTTMHIVFQNGEQKKAPIFTASKFRGPNPINSILRLG